MADWQSFRFPNPTTDFERQFNALAAIDPMQAFAYATLGSGPTRSQNINTLRSAMDTQFLGAPYNPEGNSWPNSIGNAVISAFQEPGGSYTARQTLGLGADWNPPSYPSSLLGGAQQPAPWSPPTAGTGGGMQQPLQGYGIPGFETNPMVGGGSWEGTTWPGKQYSGLKENPIPQTDVTNPNSPYYRPIYNAGNIQTEGGTTPGFQINPAVPYQTTWYLQTYGGKQPPYINIHEQLGDAMGGIAPAKPGFNWASPQALAQLGGYGLPGGWTSMLGFTPGGAKNG